MKQTKNTKKVKLQHNACLTANCGAIGSLCPAWLCGFLPVSADFFEHALPHFDLEPKGNEKRMMEIVQEMRGLLGQEP